MGVLIPILQTKEQSPRKALPMLKLKDRELTHLICCTKVGRGKWEEIGKGGVFNMESESENSGEMDCFVPQVWF